MQSSVTRSTSDVCNSTTSDALKKRRERKERPYKSDPFTGSVYLPAGTLIIIKNFNAVFCCFTGID